MGKRSMGCEKEPKKKASVGRVRKVYICVQTKNYYINNGAEKKCRLWTDCGLIFLGLENNGTIIVTDVLICMVKTIVCRLCFILTDYIIIGGSTHLNASSLHVNIYLILSLVDCNVKI